jgi:hypothetical protein
MRSILFTVSLLGACATPGLEIDLDSALDGLLDGEEREMGTDPGTFDTDGDGYSDGRELDSFTDPLDSDDHPLQGGWDLGECRSSIESTGNAVGDIAEDFALIDQYDQAEGYREVVRLHDFCHKEVLVLYGFTG